MLPTDSPLAQLLLPLGLFGMCSMLAWLAGNYWFGRSRTAEQRLQYLRRVGLGDGHHRDAVRAKRSAVARWLQKASPHLAKPFQPNDTAGASKLRLRLSHAGFTSEGASSIFLACKVTSLLIGLVFGGGVLLYTTGLNANTAIRVAVIALLAMFLPDVILHLLASRRKKAIFLGLPDAIDLMVACVEAGLGLDQAMRRVAEEMATSHAIIAREFGLANLQLQMGINRSQVLRDLARIAHRDGSKKPPAGYKCL
jgi:tight adherence protein C